MSRERHLRNAALRHLRRSAAAPADLRPAGSSTPLRRSTRHRARRAKRTDRGRLCKRQVGGFGLRNEPIGFVSYFLINRRRKRHLANPQSAGARRRRQVQVAPAAHGRPPQPVSVAPSRRPAVSPAGRRPVPGTSSGVDEKTCATCDRASKSARARRMARMPQRNSRRALPRIFSSLAQQHRADLAGRADMRAAAGAAIEMLDADDAQGAGALARFAQGPRPRPSPRTVTARGGWQTRVH